MNSKIISIHGGHNSSITFVDKNDQLRIFELERFTGIKNDMIEFPCTYVSDDPKIVEKVKFLLYTKSQMKESPTHILYSNLPKKYITLIKKVFKNSKTIQMGHHTSHCIGAYQQSGFKDALVISMDGGGVEFDHYGITKDVNGYRISFCILQNTQNIIKILSCNNFNSSKKIIPGHYAGIGLFLKEIQTKNKNELREVQKIIELDHPTQDDFDLFKDLLYKIDNDLIIGAGKLMGLAAYGKVKKEFIIPIKNIYNYDTYEYYNIDSFKKVFLGFRSINENLNFLSFSGQDSFDLAATNQYVFEELCFELIKPYIDSCKLNVVFSGGCALNVIFNQKIAKYLRKTNRELFVSPTPTDVGLSYGHTCSIDKTIDSKQFSVYSGIDILDRNKIPEYYNRYNKVGKVIKLS